DHPVMVRQGRILATSFHPELTGDSRIHQMLLDLI
ncbi:MAG TPA: pyridoxal 5'-phosphate synthase glutaminase subunit PdxT, partial [Acidimicrobiia bacterium]|nr:pyridoxal 5'-phosphate synthase glutaminase subunit PdxT [Acidimicrobiia bacterium]